MASNRKHPHEDLTLEDLLGPDFKPVDPQWYCMPFWKTEEAVSLSFGIDPEITGLALAHSHPVTEAYAKRLLIVQRAQELKQLSDPIEPNEFSRWAKNRGIELPDELTESLGDTAKEAGELDALRQENEALRRDCAERSRTMDELKEKNRQLKIQLRLPGNLTGL